MATLDDLERRIAVLEKQGGSEALQPTYLTIDPSTGLVGANFTGIVNALGLILPAGAGGVYQPQNQIQWQQLSNGALVAQIAAGSAQAGATQNALTIQSRDDGGPGQPTSTTIRATGQSNTSTAAVTATANTAPPSVQASAQSPSGALQSVNLIAGDGSTGYSWPTFVSRDYCTSANGNTGAGWNPTWQGGVGNWANNFNTFPSGHGHNGSGVFYFGGSAPNNAFYLISAQVYVQMNGFNHTVTMSVCFDGSTSNMARQGVERGYDSYNYDVITGSWIVWPAGSFSNMEMFVYTQGGGTPVLGGGGIQGSAYTFVEVARLFGVGR